MDKVIVYVDDAAHAREFLEPLSAAAPAGQIQWVVIACAPRMTHRISKWVSHSARESWRAKWADRLFEALLPALRSHGHSVTPVLARGPLNELTAQIQAEMGSTRVLDARRVKAPDAPKADAPSHGPQRTTPWAAPGALGSWLAGVGALIALAGD